MTYSGINISFNSHERAAMAKIAYDAAEKGLPFAIQTAHRVTLFNPVNFTALDMPGQQTFQFNDLQSMMAEVSGLLFVAKSVYLPQNKIDDKDTNQLLIDLHPTI